MWIESHGNLARHPKTRRLMQRMGWTLPFTIGNLHLLWWWALDFAPDGDLTRFEPDQIAADLDLGGATPEQFIEAMIHSGFIDRLGSGSAESRSGGMMVQSGFLDRIDGTLLIHDWLDYTARSVRPRRKAIRSSPEADVPSANQAPVPSCAMRVPKLVGMALRAVPGINTPDPVSNVAQTFPTRDAASAEQEPVSHTDPAPAPTTPAIPQALAELPGFTDTWWPKLLDIHEANGTPLSTDAQRELLTSLANNPFSAIEELRARINNAANAYARAELLENTS